MSSQRNFQVTADMLTRESLLSLNSSSPTNLPLKSCLTKLELDTFPADFHMKTDAMPEAATSQFMHGNESQHALPESDPPDGTEHIPPVIDVAIKTEPTPNAMTSQGLHTFDGLHEICGIVLPTFADHSTPANNNWVKIEPTADLATPQSVHSTRKSAQLSTSKAPTLVERKRPVKDNTIKAGSTSGGDLTQSTTSAEIPNKPLSLNDSTPLLPSPPTNNSTAKAQAKAQDDRITLPQSINVLPALPELGDAINQNSDGSAGPSVKDESVAGVAGPESPGATETTPVLSRARDLGLKDNEVPTDPAAILTHRYHYQYTSYTPSRIIAAYISRLSNSKVLEERDCQVVYDILKSLSQLTNITIAVERALDIRFMLNGIMGEKPLRNRPYSFPHPFPADAATILDHVEQEMGYEEIVPKDDSPPPPTSPVAPNKKRKRSTTSPLATAKRQNVNRQNINPNAREYNGILRNLLITPTGFAIKDKSLAISCHRFGENGLKVGDWWPFQVAAVRDGAHGASMAGIAGGQNDGAKSIVVGGCES